MRNGVEKADKVLIEELRQILCPLPFFLQIHPKIKKNVPGIRQDEGPPSRLGDPQKRTRMR